MVIRSLIVQEISLGLWIQFVLDAMFAYFAQRDIVLKIVVSLQLMMIVSVIFEYFDDSNVSCPWVWWCSRGWSSSCSVQSRTPSANNRLLDSVRRGPYRMGGAASVLAAASVMMFGQILEVGKFELPEVVILFPCASFVMFGVDLHASLVKLVSVSLSSVVLS
jgi:hypothetical protein